MTLLLDDFSTEEIYLLQCGLESINDAGHGELKHHLAQVLKALMDLKQAKEAYGNQVRHLLNARDLIAMQRAGVKPAEVPEVWANVEVKRR